MVIDATSEFDDVQGQYVTDSAPILLLLETIAEDAKTQVINAGSTSGMAFVASTVATNLIDDFQTEAISATGNESAAIVDPTAPTEPTQVEILTLATEYLDWLHSETISAAQFPEYTELEE